MPGLINLLQQVLESSKRNILVVKKLISILERNVDVEGSAEQDDELFYDDLKPYRSTDSRYESFNFREDNLSWEQELDGLDGLDELDKLDNLNDSDEEYQNALISIDDEIPGQNTPELHEIDSTPEPTPEPTPELLKPEARQPDAELITPLSKLSLDEQNKLLFSMFQTAKNNVKNIIGIPENSDNFEKEVTKEADRLLQTWMELNKTL